MLFFAWWSRYEWPLSHSLPFASTWIHPRFFGGSVFLIFLCVFKFWIPCCDVRYDFRIKTMFGSSLPPVISGVSMSYLRYLCLFAYDGVQHIMCWVFDLFFFLVCSLMPVPLDCPFFIGPSVVSNVYSHNQAITPKVLIKMIKSQSYMIVIRTTLRCHYRVFVFLNKSHSHVSQPLPLFCFYLSIKCFTV